MKIQAYLDRHPWMFPSLMIAMMLLGVANPAWAQTPAMTFTVKTTTADGRTVVPEFTWSTTPAATKCTASGATGWNQDLLPAGTLALPAIAVTKSFRLVCTWAGDQTATVRWTAPTKNNDGTDYTNPGGYRIQYGRSATALDQSQYLQDPAARTWVSPALSPAGPWFFSVRAFNVNGLESDLPTPVSKTITVGATVERTLQVVVSFPNAPTDVTVQ